MTTLPKNVLSTLFATALAYAKCSVSTTCEPRACVIYSASRKTIVSMGYQEEWMPPEHEAKRKLRWLDRGNLYAICSHVPTFFGATELHAMKVKEVYYMHTIESVEGLKILKEYNIPSTRLVYG